VVHDTVLTKVFAIVFVYGKFIVFVFVFKYYAMHLDKSDSSVHQHLLYHVSHPTSISVSFSVYDIINISISLTSSLFVG